MPNISRTVNPLHFEDLEPKRFEDLVRQLAYEFRRWRKLEATGRAGSDDGFDARGWEVVGETADEEQSGEEASDELQHDTSSVRLWLIQCKREKSIGPTKLEGYMDAIPVNERPALYGVVFAAACDFSKASRDRFHSKSATFGFSECYLWGKAELEDMLFQPKNDHLLFAYFGFSLTIRQRSLRTELRARLAMKRKVYRHLEEHAHQSVLIRDPEAKEYPYSDDVPDFVKRPSWRVYVFDSFTHLGPKFRVRQSCAYVTDDGKKWDVALAYNHEAVIGNDDPWGQDEGERRLIRSTVLAAWGKLKDKNKAWLNVYGIVPYEEILDIDEKGDDWAGIPHIYAPFKGDEGPFAYLLGNIENCIDDDAEKIRMSPNSEMRMVFFDEEYRHRPGYGSTKPAPKKKKKTKK